MDRASRAALGSSLGRASVLGAGISPKSARPRLLSPALSMNTSTPDLKAGLVLASLNKSIHASARGSARGSVFRPGARGLVSSRVEDASFGREGAQEDFGARFSGKGAVLEQTQQNGKNSEQLGAE